jgi:hypothetical protein
VKNQKSVPESAVMKSEPSASSNDNTSGLQAALFGPPPLLEGEDPEAYNRLLHQVTAAVKPRDIFEKIWVADIVHLTWEILRWRRLQPRVIQINTKVGARYLLNRCKPLKVITDASDHEEDTDPSDHEEATDPSNHEEDTDSSDHEEAADPSDHEDDDDTDPSDLEDDTDPSDDEEDEQYSPFANEFLVLDFAAGCPKAIKKVKEQLASANRSLDSIIAYGLAAGISEIERIDHMTMQAEKRRDRALHEIESHRAGFGKALRSAMDIVDAEFDPVEAPQIEDEAA